jgi:argininosuccinate lyase
VNRLVKTGVPFREAYRTVAEQIRQGKYTHDYVLSHSHEGSLGNLSNDMIEKKMEKLYSEFGFEKAEEAICKLLEK